MKKLRLRTFRYGEPPRGGDGLRILAVRRPPRGTSKADWPRHFDVWLPVVAPSADLLRRLKQCDSGNAETWPWFFAAYERELFARAESRQSVELLAQLALRTPISLGCYCAEESRCHRSHLRRLVERAAAAAGEFDR